MEPTQPQPIAIWNSARDVWETPATEGFFCEHLDVFSETFPTSGMTVNGAAYALPTWGGVTADTGSSSLLPTVTTSETTGPGRGPKKSGGENLRTAISLMPTPTTQDAANNGGPSQFNRNTPPLNTRVLMLETPTAALAGGVQTLEAQVGGRQKFKKLLPTTPAQHGEDRNNAIYQRPLDQPQNLENALALLPTPSACVANDGEGTETWLAWRERVKLTAANGNGMGMPLTIATQLIGETTSQLSAAGNESLDGRLPGQLSLLDAMADPDSARDSLSG